MTVQAPLAAFASFVSPRLSLADLRADRIDLASALDPDSIAHLERWYADPHRLRFGDAFAVALPVLDAWLALIEPEVDDEAGEAGLDVGRVNFVAGLATGALLDLRFGACGASRPTLGLRRALRLVSRVEPNAELLCSNEHSATRRALLACYDALRAAQPRLETVVRELHRAVLERTPRTRLGYGPRGWSRVHFLAGLVAAGLAEPAEPKRRAAGRPSKRRVPGDPR
jgi:hypothetical protein